MAIPKAALKIQRDKEVAAMMYNTKEQRVLEKSLQTLRLEQTYALKLLELDHRIIKVRHKRLKGNVAKIKSHLPADDINNFRDLDLQGKLSSGKVGCVNLGSAIKIAGAARRLNLGAGFKRRGGATPRSALPRISVEKSDRANVDFKSKSIVTINDPPVVERFKRPNSVTGAFIDAPLPNAGFNRPASAFINSRTNGNHKNDFISTNNSQSPAGKINERKGISQRNEDHQSVIQNPTQRLGAAVMKDALTIPLTNGFDSEEEEQQHSQNKNQCIERPWPSVRSSSSLHVSSRSPFSSHSPGTEKPRMKSAPARQRRRMSHMSTDSIDSNLGESTAEEKRQELLEEECVRAETLGHRTKLFLKDVDDYLQRNPPLQSSHVALENGLPDSTLRPDSVTDPVNKDENSTKRNGSAGGTGNGRVVRFQQRLKDRSRGPVDELEFAPTFMPEADYKERLMDLWKDMNKCRYLRISDDKVDLSGVNTLVKDNMKLFQTLKSTDKSKSRQAWEV